MAITGLPAPRRTPLTLSGEWNLHSLMKAFLRCGCVLLLVYGEALGDSISLTPVADTTISENNVAANAGMPATGSSGTMMTGRLTGNGQESRCRGLLRFDLSAIPAGATITSATLTVSVTRNHLTGGSDTHAIHRLTLPWTEGGATYLSTGTEPWNGGEFIGSADSTVALGDPAAFTFPSSEAMVATAQMWLTNAATNHGWVLRNQDEETLGNARRIATREVSSGQAALTLQYTLPAVPLDILITNSMRVGNQFSFNFAGEPGRSYTVEYKDDLNVATWATHIVFPAPAQPTNFTVLDSLNGNRFFRVRAD